MFHINKIPSLSLFDGHKLEDPFLSPFLSISRQHAVQIHHPILNRCKLCSNVQQYSTILHTHTHDTAQVWVHQCTTLLHNVIIYCSGVQMYCHYLTNLAPPGRLMCTCGNQPQGAISETICLIGKVFGLGVLV